MRAREKPGDRVKEMRRAGLGRGELGGGVTAF